MKKVVVTGLGLVTSLGDGVSQSWNNLINSLSGIKKIDYFEVNDLSCQIAGFIEQNEEKEYYFDPNKYVAKKDLKKIDRFILYGLAASTQAIKDAGIENLNDEKKERIGVSLGSGIGGLESIYKTTIELYEKSPRKISPFFIPAALINLLSGQVSIKYGFKGPNHSVVTACATGAHSIGDATEIIKRGEADIMVAGSSEASVCRIGIAGFSAARSLSTNFNNRPKEASRPWDKERDGFVMGEGAGVIILEEYEHAKKRGAKIYSEIIGYGMSGDAYHITSPSLDGDGAYRAMKSACKNAKIDPEDIDYINAHGTSTKVGDQVEIASIKKLFNGNKFKAKISSTKSSIGHLLGAAGSVEAIFAILSICNNKIPGTLNLINPSEDCNLNLVAIESIDQKTDISLTNSFGFGGTNAALLFRKI